MADIFQRGRGDKGSFHLSAGTPSDVNMLHENYRLLDLADQTGGIPPARRILPRPVGPRESGARFDRANVRRDICWSRRAVG